MASTQPLARGGVKVREAGGVTAYKVNDARQHGSAHAGPAAVVQRGGDSRAAATAGSSKTPAALTQDHAFGKDTTPGQIKDAKTADDGKSKGKPDDPGANANAGTAADKTDKPDKTE